ncbi:MAG: glucosaminidase domain-containing protein [Treponema sp.]|nr:glucosaminidase domain-containing protein [Treponema sp.]
MGKGLVPKEKLTRFLTLNNPYAKPDFAQILASIYIDEAADEGVNHDIAFAQMCLETGYLKYGGLVLPEWNNFCGLGAIGPQQPGEIFPDTLTGVRAHIQHLKAYATEEPLKSELVDPRYKYVRKGSSPGIDGLSGTWAVDKSYSVKIKTILRRLYIFSF